MPKKKRPIVKCGVLTPASCIRYQGSFFFFSFFFFPFFFTDDIAYDTWWKYTLHCLFRDMHSQIGALSRWLESYYLPSSRYKLGSSSSSGADKTPETKLHYYYFFSFVYHGYTYRQAHVCVCVSLTLPYLTLPYFPPCYLLYPTVTSLLLLLLLLPSQNWPYIYSFQYIYHTAAAPFRHAAEVKEVLYICTYLYKKGVYIKRGIVATAAAVAAKKHSWSTTTITTVHATTAAIVLYCFVRFFVLR